MGIASSICVYCLNSATQDGRVGAFYGIMSAEEIPLMSSVLFQGGLLVDHH